MNLFLIGYRGTGKSTLARLLAARLGWRALDADAEIQRIAGCSIAEIFARGGEAAFRALEHRHLASLCGLHGLVVATGGGVVLRPQNRQLLRHLGVAVWLQADAATIAARLAADAATQHTRPNLTAAGGREEIEQLLQQRRPLYAATADYAVWTAGRAPSCLADQVAEAVRRRVLTRQPWGGGKAPPQPASPHKASSCRAEQS